IVFGPKWDGIGLVIGVIALMQGFSWVIGVNGEAYRALGRPAYETAVMSSVLLIYLAGYLIGIQHGFESFIWTRLVVGLVGVAFQLYFCHRLLELDATGVVRMIVLATIGGLAFYSGHGALFRWAIETWMQASILFCCVVVVVAVALAPQVRGGAAEFARLMRHGKAPA
ncbi:MAG: hypothetical protein OEQ29_16325, partial [Alphaproteobacteria bacterium]|nr:hypothetical protein [Alphaproteobacteria bacterium]